MYTKQALRALGVMSDLSPAHKRELDEVGFIIVEDVISEAQARQMAEEFERLHDAEKTTGGQEVHVEPGARRLSNIFNKSAVFDPLLEIGPALAAAHYVLGEIKVHGANIRDPVKGFGHQQLHVDVPKKFADDWWLVNAMILFDDMTLDNGPTRVIPGSHRWAPINVPVVNQGDWEPAPLSPEDQARVPADLECSLSGRSDGDGAGRRCGDPQLVGLAQRDAQEQRCAAAADPPFLHTPRSAAATRPARSPDAGALRSDEPRAPISSRDRAAKGWRRRAASPETRP